MYELVVDKGKLCSQCSTPQVPELAAFFGLINAAQGFAETIIEGPLRDCPSGASIWGWHAFPRRIQLHQERKKHKSLKIGDISIKPLETRLAYLRHTKVVREARTWKSFV